MKNFDIYVGIDWSGALKPVYTRSIAVAVCAAGDDKAPALVQPSKKNHWSRSGVVQWLETLIKSPQRALVGIDANFGYAAEISAKQLGPQRRCYDLWAQVDDLNSDVDNFFAGNFWRKYHRDFWVEGTKPDHMDLPKRLTEEACGRSGYGWPESPFKLLGPKQVGKGGLAAMRVAHYLKQKYGDQVCIWPFEHHLWDRARLVISEIYPRQFLRRAGHGATKIKTLQDLNAALGYFGSAPMVLSDIITDHDSDALISAAGLRWLCGGGDVCPSYLADPVQCPFREKVRVEGWIFGVETATLLNKKPLDT